MSSWKYDKPDWRERFEVGLENVNDSDLISDFEKWVSTKEYTFLKKSDSAEVIWCLNSKRGNETYAKKQKLKFDDIGNALSNKVLDFPADVKGFRPGSVRYTYGLFVTLTFAQDRFTKCEAWESVTDLVNQFKAYLRKYLGCDYSSFLVKEGNSAGYPAPHMIILLDRPVLSFLHTGKDGIAKWRIRDRKIVDVLHDAWERYSRSPVMDIQGIVQGSIGSAGTIAYYLSKYMGKSVDLSNKTAVLTHAYQKLYRLRDVVGKSFRRRLDMECDKPLTRLDIYNNELKPLKKKLALLEQDYREYGALKPGLIEEYRITLNLIELLQAQRPPPDWVYLDSFTVRRHSDYQKLLDLILVYTT